MKRVPFVAYNLGPAGAPHRGAAQVRLELNALANNHRPDADRKRPKVIGVFEGINRRLPSIHGYRKFRSTKTLSRANLGLYVLDNLDVGPAEWVDHEKTWARTERPGVHEARSTLVQHVEDWTVIVGHAPPVTREGAHDTDAAREEWLDVMVRIIRDADGPVLALTDPNGLGDDMRRRVPSLVMCGTAVEAAHAKGAVFDAAHTPDRVNDVLLLSDHRKALLGRAVRR